MSRDLLALATVVSVSAIMVHLFFVTRFGILSRPTLVAHAVAATSFFAVGILYLFNGESVWGSATILIGCFAAATLTYFMQKLR